MISYRTNHRSPRVAAPSIIPPAAPRRSIGRRHPADALGTPSVVGRELLHDIGRALDRFALSASEFGTRAVNDPRLVTDLRRGSVPGENRCARVRTFIAQMEAGHGA